MKVSLYPSFCHSKRGGFITEWFGNCQNCHCKRGVTVNGVTVSGEVCTRKSYCKLIASYYKKFFIHRARANLRPLLLTKSSHICSKKWSRICRSSMYNKLTLYLKTPTLGSIFSAIRNDRW